MSEEAVQGIRDRPRVRGRRHARRRCGRPITTGTGGWLWPMEPPEPQGRRQGALRRPRSSPGIRRTGYTNRVEDVEGISEQTLNQLDYTIEPRDDGRRAWVRYVHSGIFVDDWDNQYDGAAKHTDFYLHTLRQYLTHFAGRPAAAFATFDGPEAAKAADALAVVGRALGLGGRHRRRRARSGPRARRQSSTPWSTTATRTSSGCAPTTRPHPFLRPQPLGLPGRHQRPRLRTRRRRQGVRRPPGRTG